MTTYAYPTTGVFVPEKQSLLVQQNQKSTTSILSGDTQTLTRPGARWGWDIDLSECDPAELAMVEAFLTRLNGREHLVTIYDFLRPVPRGTCNLTGVTVNGATSQFATTVSLAGCGAAKTLLAGDWIKLNTQLVMVAADATANGSGVMTVEFRHMLRLALGGGASVTLDHPTSTYILNDSNLEIVRQSGFAQPPIKFRLIEDFTP